MFKVDDKVQVVSLNKIHSEFSVVREMVEGYKDDRTRVYEVRDVDINRTANRYQLSNGWWYEEQMLKLYRAEDDLFRDKLLQVDNVVKSEGGYGSGFTF